MLIDRESFWKELTPHQFDPFGNTGQALTRPGRAVAVVAPDEPA